MSELRRGLTVEAVEEARRQVIEWIGPEGGPLPTFGALSDLLEASRQWLELEELTDPPTEEE